MYKKDPTLHKILTIDPIRHTEDEMAPKYPERREEKQPPVCLDAYIQQSK